MGTIDERDGVALSVRSVGPSDADLQSVMALWRQHSATLGFFPQGAFEEYARRGHLLSCFYGDSLAGYTAFRVSGRWATIAHLCIAMEFRGHGIAKSLLNELAKQTSHLDGIKLNCRRDFDAHKMWPKLGFVSVKETPGRAGVLVMWARANHHEDLFARAQPPSSALINVAVDANVFFSLTNSDFKSDETEALRADWLSDQLRLQVTEEIFNEVDRNQDPEVRRQTRQSAQAFGVLKCKPTEYQAAVDAVRPLFPALLSESSQSDVRQLARAIGSRADVFLTFDEKLLSLADEVYARSHGLRVMKPVDLIIELDVVSREAEYRPSRYRETGLVRRKATDPAEELASRFVRLGEKQRDFSALIRRLQSVPQEVQVEVISEKNDPIAMFTLDRREDSVLRIPILRTRPGPLSRSLTRSLMARAVQSAADEKRDLVLLTDVDGSEELAAAMEELEFTFSDGAWGRVVITGYLKLDALQAGASPPPVQLPVKCERWFDRTVDSLHARQSFGSAGFAATAEHALWPAKIEDANLPAYLVPIRRTFAERLLDPCIGHPQLFGREPIDAMRIEGAYYSGAQVVMSAPARIIWYVSGDGARKAWASSLLEEVMVDEPKPLFRRFRRLGVYDWSDVAGSIRRDGKVLAMRFSGTEVFKRPIPLAELLLLLPEESRANFVAPVVLSEGKFIALYRQAMA